MIYLSALTVYLLPIYRNKRWVTPNIKFPLNLVVRREVSRRYYHSNLAFGPVSRGGETSVVSHRCGKSYFGSVLEVEGRLETRRKDVEGGSK